MKYLHLIPKGMEWHVPDVEYIKDTGLRYDIGILNKDDYLYCTMNERTRGIIPIDGLLCSAVERAMLWDQLHSYGIYDINIPKISVDNIIRYPVTYIIILYLYSESTGWTYVPSEMRKIKEIFVVPI